MSPTANTIFRARTVIEEIAVSTTITDLCKVFPRVEEAFEGIKWRLAHRPDDAGAILVASTGKRLIRFPTYENHSGSVEVPSMTVEYDFDENAVTIYRIRVPNWRADR